jgi:hypothetical protein
MKKIIFSIISSMLISTAALQAQQQDTTGISRHQRTQQNRQQPDRNRQQQDQTRQQQDQTRQQYSDQNRNEGMVVIEKDQLPSSLKRTLQDEKYAGWENATIYKNTNTGEYVIAPRAYRFNKQGKEIKGNNNMGQGYGDRQGRQDQYNRDQSQQRSSTQDRDQSQQQSSTQDPNRTRESQSAQNQQRSQNQAQDEMDETPTSASEDRTGNNQQPDENQTQQPSTSFRNDQNNQPGQNDQNQYRTEDMIEIQTEQIPASLRRTLREDQYEGWEESGTLYQEPTTGEYVLVMERTSDSSEPRSYRFDKNGQLKDDQNTGDENRNNNDQ